MASLLLPQDTLQWDLFCRVIDNLGDIGVCWRLAADLAQRGDRVRLITDEPAALAWMAPGGHPRVQVRRWCDDGVVSAHADGVVSAHADVVVEAFGCELPAPCVSAMQQRQPAPVWLNLEHLSAEAFVERCHGLPSPQASGLRKWFFYPGFSAHTGGLLREPGLLQRRRRFDRRDWLNTMGLTPRSDEQVVSLFCYDNPCLPHLLADLAVQPTLLLLTAAVAQQPWMPKLQAQGLRVQVLPWLSQADYDHLLWSCDLNWVRGEDSLVRALWAGVPWVWQAYVQHDLAHHAKVLALLDRLNLPAEVAALWRAWNGLPECDWPGLPPAAQRQHWQRAAADRGAGLDQQPDLATALRAFAQQQLKP